MNLIVHDQENGFNLCQLNYYDMYCEKRISGSKYTVCNSVQIFFLKFEYCTYVKNSSLEGGGGVQGEPIFHSA